METKEYICSNCRKPMSKDSALCDTCRKKLPTAELNSRLKKKEE